MNLMFLGVCALLAGNVLLRTFTNDLRVLPRAFNLIDIPIVFLLFALYLISPKAPQPAWSAGIIRRTVGFCVVALLGTLLNGRYLYPAAALSQATMLILPLLLFVAMANTPFREEEVQTYVKLLRRLLVLQVVVGCLQLPGRIGGGDSELVHGTFPGNAEQYAAFVMIGIYYLAASAALNPGRTARYWGAILAILLLIVSIDNKASWVGTAVSLAVVVWYLGGLRGRRASLIGLGLSVVFVVGAVSLFALQTSNTLYRFAAMAEAVRTGQVTKLGKVKAYIDIIKSHTRHPHMLLLGAGLSNFYSRASRQFYLSMTSKSRMYLNPTMLDKRVHEDSNRGSDSTGGLIGISVREPYYGQFYEGQDMIFAVGSHQIDTPFSMYTGLLGETGLLGTWLYLACYLVIYRQLVGWVKQYRQDPVILPLASAALGFTVYLTINSLYGPLLETTRMTTILWGLIGMVFAYSKLHPPDSGEAGIDFVRP